MFHVVDRLPPLADAGQVYLVIDNWDDWFSFRTMFTMVIDAPNRIRHHAGSVKIGEAGLRPSGGGNQPGAGVRAPTLPAQFDRLDPGRFFSLGQNENYYETLNNLDVDFKRAILEGLQDCAYELALFMQFEREEVMQQSLLRSVRPDNVTTRLHRLAHGNAVLTRFHFEYVFPQHRLAQSPPPELSFSVRPDSEPPTNVHVIVGRNGVGKTSGLQSLINTILELDTPPGRGTLRLLGDEEWAFAGLVSVSFSAFDSYLPPRTESLRIRAAFVGLQKTVIDEAGQSIAGVKTPHELAGDFVDSLQQCRSGPRRIRWLSAVETLSNDPLFAEANVANLLELEDDTWADEARRLYGLLSSGHAIVLLTTTRLVELVDEKTLVILDEPEGHLHPPLLSAFVRAVADLLVSRNGVGVIATHSPVVLQEVPRACVWKLRRTGAEAVAERPAIETFGEGVGVLTREVFGLEVTNAGFHRLIQNSVNQPGATYESVVAQFEDQLGAEAKALTRSLVALNAPPRGAAN